MNKAELIEALSGRLGDRKSAVAALDAVLAEIQNTVTKGDKVSITGFGVFEKRVRAARTARNPRTGESVKVKKTAVPAFRPGTGFKDLVANGKAPKAAATATNKRTVAPARAAAAKTSAAATKATAAKATATKTAAKSVAATKVAAAKTATRAATVKAAPATKTTAAKTAAPKTTAAKATAAKTAVAKAAPARKTTKAAPASAPKATTPRATKKAPGRSAAK